MDLTADILTAKNIMFKCKRDVDYDPKTTARHRRIEWPTADDTLQTLFQSMQETSEANAKAGTFPEPKAVSSSTRLLIDEETSKCDTRCSEAGDESVIDIIFWNRPDYFKILANLYWRARRQSAIWDCYTQLVESGLVDITCLEHRVFWINSEFKDLFNVLQLLKVFSAVCEDEDRIHNYQVPAQGMDFDADLEWLAIMIVCGGRNLREIFAKLAQTNYLGDVVEEDFDAYLGMNGGKLPNITFGVRPDAVNYREYKAGHVFGFILPHGLNSLSGSDVKHHLADVRLFEHKFNAIEEAFRMEAGIPREKLLLEEEQA